MRASPRDPLHSHVVCWLTVLEAVLSSGRCNGFGWCTVVAVNVWVVLGPLGEGGWGWCGVLDLHRMFKAQQQHSGAGTLSECKSEDPLGIVNVRRCWDCQACMVSQHSLVARSVSGAAVTLCAASLLLLESSACRRRMSPGPCSLRSQVPQTPFLTLLQRTSCPVVTESFPWCRHSRSKRSQPVLGDAAGFGELGWRGAQLAHRPGGNPGANGWFL